MHCDEWLDIERQYRVAVHRYSDAVDRLDSARDFEGAWQQIELARTDADHARSALLGHQRKHLCVQMRNSNHVESSGVGAEELVLGDQGQPGG